MKISGHNIGFNYDTKLIRTSHTLQVRLLNDTSGFVLGCKRLRF